MQVFLERFSYAMLATQMLESCPKVTMKIRQMIQSPPMSFVSFLVYELTVRAMILVKILTRSIDYTNKPSD